MRNLMLAGLLVSTLLVSTQSRAVTIEFSGTVSGIFGPFSTTTHLPDGDLPTLSFGVGAPITGQIVWDNTVVDTNPNPTNGLYSGALSLLQIQIGGNTWEVTGGDVEIIPGVTDPIQIFGIAMGDALGSFSANQFVVDFNDPTDFIQEDSLPTVDASFLSLIEGGSFSLNFIEGAERVFEVEGGAFSYTVVPEPSAAFLLGLGLVGLGARRRMV